ncbi:hypothetical protein T01_4962 [Trichinella spiralis]|uniref:Uncharacterized protein n=1 Tax=Trichinella spiralis TaxID=6334 RepID=A0A0V1BAX0_TRISP|nr:hypothetical protein T01_4962 [Trichinella spiralis]
MQCNTTTTYTLLPVHHYDPVYGLHEMIRSSCLNNFYLKEMHQYSTNFWLLDNFALLGHHLFLEKANYLSWSQYYGGGDRYRPLLHSYLIHFHFRHIEIIASFHYL